ncbi:hypothetical protein TYRP_002695 [Tyrophagus putrescentiae]|nr:hypothetical protein TYRP_002695 [Tyrophagus putrescentiae]
MVASGCGGVLCVLRAAFVDSIAGRVAAGAAAAAGHLVLDAVDLLQEVGEAVDKELLLERLQAEDLLVELLQGGDQRVRLLGGGGGAEANILNAITSITATTTVPIGDDVNDQRVEGGGVVLALLIQHVIGEVRGVVLVRIEERTGLREVLADARLVAVGRRAVARILWRVSNSRGGGGGGGGAEEDLLAAEQRPQHVHRLVGQRRAVRKGTRPAAQVVQVEVVAEEVRLRLRHLKFVAAHDEGAAEVLPVTDASSRRRVVVLGVEGRVLLAEA